MSDPHLLVTPLDLDAFVDGQLAPARAAAVDERLRVDATSLNRVFALARVNAELRRARASAYSDTALREAVARLMADRPARRAAAG